VVYLVLGDFGPIGQAYREADPATDDEQAIIGNLLSGQYSHPQRIVAFSSMEEWARDVTTEAALKVLKQAIAQGRKLPEATRVQGPSGRVGIARYRSFPRVQPRMRNIYREAQPGGQNRRGTCATPGRDVFPPHATKASRL
jgi:hypothetical protein